MKHATSRLLFAYWDSLRGLRAAPDRGEIEPTRIRHVLADTFILGVDGESRHHFRLAGTRCSALFGSNLKNRPFADLWGSDPSGGQDLVDIVTADTTGLVAGLRGTTEAGIAVDIELLLLPLRYLGRARDRMVGAMSLSSTPSWLGLVPVAHLETRSVRIIHTAAAAAASRPARMEARERFVVHEGGRR